MNSKEIINRVIEFNEPPRIGLDFNQPHQDDIDWILVGKLKNEKYEDRTDWGYYKKELSEVPDFKGEVRRDVYGNIYGRLNQKTKGECIKGVLQDGWEQLADFQMPVYDELCTDEIKSNIQEQQDKFLLGALPVGIFSTMRDLRRIDNILMDVILEEDNVKKLLGRIEKLAASCIEKSCELRFDGIIFYDDWGDQNSLLINPQLWRKLFKPVYDRLVSQTHDSDMKFFIHSCGYVAEIIEDFIEIGVDVLQFDQPQLMGVEKLGNDFGSRITFWSPVDIQQVMPTGDKKKIQNEARNMIKQLGENQGGFIAKDYPTWEDIDISDKWANWARQVFIEQGSY